MKKLIVAAAVGLTAVGALAQGQFNFANRVTAAGIDAPVYKDFVGGTKLDGAGWLAQAYVGLTESSLSPVGTALAFRSGAAAGYITSTAVTVPNIAAGQSVVVKMAAWDATKGTSFEAAVTAGALAAMSKPVTLTLSGPPSAPTDMKGLEAFALIPEPSTMALGLLGVAALLLRRRN